MTGPRESVEGEGCMRNSDIRCTGSSRICRATVGLSQHISTFHPATVPTQVKPSRDLVELKPRIDKANASFDQCGAGHWSQLGESSRTIQMPRGSPATTEHTLPLRYLCNSSVCYYVVRRTGSRAERPARSSFMAGLLRWTTANIVSICRRAQWQSATWRRGLDRPLPWWVSLLCLLFACRASAHPSGPGTQSCGVNGYAPDSSNVDWDFGCNDACCCREICLQTQGCETWQYYHDNGQNRCYLRSGLSLAPSNPTNRSGYRFAPPSQIGRASCRERV